jgi:hypothetical protein
VATATDLLLHAAAALAPRSPHATPRYAIAGARAVRTTPTYFDAMGWGTHPLMAFYPGETGESWRIIPREDLYAARTAVMSPWRNRH